MTSRERLLKTLSGEPTDRVPISCYELNAWDEDNWYNQQDSYRDLMAFIRENVDGVRMTAIPSPRLGDPDDGSVTVRTHREGKSVFTHVTFHTPKGPLTRRERCDDDVHTVWTLEHLLKTPDDIDRYLSIGWELGELDLGPFAAAQRRLGDDGILLPSLSDPICVAADLFEMGQFLIYALTEPDRIRCLMDVLHERQMAHLKAVLKAGLAAGVNWSETLFRICGPEYATPPYLGPEHFAALVTPYVKRMSDVIHEYGARMRLHCHGKIARVLDEIMKTDPDAMDPIEPPPDGDIELAEVKRRVGDRVCLFGNIELKLLEHGKPDEVRQFVIDAIAAAKPGGGFVIMPTAGPINVPLSAKTDANYRVFIETALEFGQY